MNLLELSNKGVKNGGRNKIEKLALFDFVRKSFFKN